jgi:FAD/FMN-containing dehydrogenase
MVVNDVHSRLNETAVRELVSPRSLADVRDAVNRAAAAGRPVAIAGGRHAMGGQQFCAGGTVLDTRRLDRVLGLDLERGLVEVEAGIQWPALARALADSPLTFAQKQTGANDLCLGGAVSANVHGRGLTMRPFVADVESLVVVGADGLPVRCSRQERPDLFRLVCGGYGLFGVVYSLELRLVPRRTLERVVELRMADELDQAFADRIAAGFLYGDFQFAIDPASSDFLQRGVFSCYRPVAACAVPVEQRVLSAADWRILLRLAHEDKSRAFELYAGHYLATNGQLYASDRHQLAQYVEGYHEAVGPGSEMITELSVPRHRLAGFLEAAAQELRSLEADVIYGTVRLIERDDETLLAWAREPWACVVLNLHVEHTPVGLERAAAAFQALNDLALAEGGTFYLTYHRWATRAQLLAAHPRLPEFLAAKAAHDPAGVFQSDWYRWLCSTLALEAAA